MMEIKMPPIMGKAPNIVGTIAVEKDQFVSEGQVLANVETGKGNRPIKVGSSGRIAEILCQEGQEVKAGQTLEQLEAGGEGSLSDSVARLRLLNDLYPSGEPRPGDWLKVVR